jgi:hypothetical protein
MMMSVEMTVFWVVALCSLVDIDQRVRGAYCLRHHGDGILMMEAVSCSETSVNIYHSTWCNIPEDSHLRKYNICSSVQLGPNEPMVRRLFNVNTLHHCNFEVTTVFLVNNTLFSTTKIIHII